MKAIIQPRYGSPDVLRLQEVEKPVLEDDRVLVRVRASSSTPPIGVSCAASHMPPAR